jgi:hypothetical protein
VFLVGGWAIIRLASVFSYASYAALRDLSRPPMICF